jgi:CBS domain-containing protein
MQVINGIRRSGVGVRPEQTIREAATIMERSGVGALAVVDGEHLVGLITDRDLVRRGMARNVPYDARIDSLMSTPVVTIDAQADLHDAFALFRTHGNRRLAVVQEGRFVGMITVDDLLINLAADLENLSRPVMAEALFGHHDSPLPATE